MAETSEPSQADILGEGIIDFLKPVVEELDERVMAVRQSQVELCQNIESLAEDLRKASEQKHAPIDLDPYLKKLSNARRRVMLVSNILQNLQERLGKLHFSVSKETLIRRALLDPPTAGPPL